MVFFKPLLLVAVSIYGVCKLYSHFRGDDSPSPSPSPPSYPRSRSRSRSPRRDSRGPTQPLPPHLDSSPTVASQRIYQAQSPTSLRQQRQPVETVPERQRLSRRNQGQHLFRVESSPSTDPYQSHDHQCPQIEPVHNAGASNRDDERDPHYLHLRDEAKKYCGHMRKFYEESQKAYSQGDHARAKELSNKGGEYKGRMEMYDQQASEWIFDQLNKDNDPCNVDLHGLYVREATARVEQILKEARARGDPSIRFIVGQGRHSEDGNAKLKPAVQKFIRESGLSLRIEPKNLGVLIVDLDPRPESSGREYFRDRTNLVL